MTAPQIVLSVAAALFVGVLFGAAIAISARRRGELVQAALSWSSARDRRQAAAEVLADHNVHHPCEPSATCTERLTWREAERAELELADQLYAATRAIRHGDV